MSSGMRFGVAQHTAQLLRVRRRLVAKRRRRHVLASAAALAFALATAVSIAALTGTDLAGAAGSRARNFADMFDQRSPGPRTAAQLTKANARHDVLAELTAPAASSAPEDLSQLIAPPAPDVPVDLGSASDVKLLMAPPTFGPIVVPPPGGGRIGPSVTGGGGGGAGGGGGGPGSPPLVPIAPLAPPLPEPGTWVTMLLGFGLMRGALRRQPAAALRVVRAS